jgi:hypothetical protein
MINDSVFRSIFDIKLLDCMVKSDADDQEETNDLELLFQNKMFDEL